MCLKVNNPEVLNVLLHVRQVPDHLACEEVPYLDPAVDEEPGAGHQGPGEDTAADLAALELGQEGGAGPLTAVPD